MTTLVTGATGFVGSHVARQLVTAGHSVRVLVRRSSDCRMIEGLPVERAEGDLRDPASLDRALQGVRRVFHVAADYRFWTPVVDEIYQNNVEGTRHLLEASARAGVEKFVYTSTVATIAVHREVALSKWNFNSLKKRQSSQGLEGSKAGAPRSLRVGIGGTTG